MRYLAAVTVRVGAFVHGVQNSRLLFAAKVVDIGGRYPHELVLDEHQGSRIQNRPSLGFTPR